jgi:hypothetical protein
MKTVLSLSLFFLLYSCVESYRRCRISQRFALLQTRLNPSIYEKSIETHQTASYSPTLPMRLLLASAVGTTTAAVLLIAKYGILSIHRKLYLKNPNFAVFFASSIVILIGKIDNRAIKPIITSVSRDSVFQNVSLNAKTIFLRFVGLIVTLGSGFSMGLAGPAAEMGMVIAAQIQRKLQIVNPTSLILAGAAAGVAANFNAPLTGILFASEVTRRIVVSNDNDMKYIDKDEQRKNEEEIWCQLISVAMAGNIIIIVIVIISLVLFALHYTTLHYTTLHYTTLHYTTLHYTTL